MSHTTKIEFEVKDLDCLEEAAAELGFSVKKNSTIKFYDGSQHRGTSVQIPGWEYPIIVKDNQLLFDNYEGEWGSMDSLNKLRQSYSRRVVIKEARKKGFRVQEETKNGRVRLRLRR